MTRKFLAYFPEDGKKVEYQTKTLLFRYLKGRLQIEGFDCGENNVRPEFEEFNRIIESVPDSVKEILSEDIKGREHYTGDITFLQDEARALIEV